MRLLTQPISDKKDNKFKHNLALLYACTKIKEISLAADEAHLQGYFDHLTSSDAEIFRKDFLIKEIQHRIPSGTPQNFEDFMKFKFDKRHVPPVYEEEYEKFHKAQKIYATRDARSEFKEELQKLHKEILEIQTAIKEKKPFDYQKIYNSLTNNDRSPAFQKFAKKMLTSNPRVINSQYRHLAKSIAKEHNLYTDTFNKNLSQTLRKPKIELYKDFGYRVFTAAKKLIPALALSAGILIGSYLPHFTQTHEAPKEGTGIETQIPGEDSNLGSPSTVTPSPTFGNPDFVPPISNSITVNSYESACKDFYQKTAEIYKYNTGEEINLSSLGQDNMAQSKTTIFTVKYQGETYYFSAQSPHNSNHNYLSQALETLPGAEITSATDTITYIHKDGESLAIVDSAGNPVRSGNILETATSGVGQMYNQTYVNVAKQMLNAQGINTSGMSEAELIGRFLVSDKHNAQNPDLSKALHETSSLVYKIKSTFYYTDGEQSTYAIHLYNQAAQGLAEDFNNQAREADANGYFVIEGTEQGNDGFDR